MRNKIFSGFLTFLLIASCCSAAVLAKEGDQTPELSALSSALGGKDVAIYVPFDDEAKDVSGHETLYTEGDLTYESGFFGKAVRVGHGYAGVEDYSVGMSSFSVMLFFKTSGVPSDPVLAATQNWDNSNNDGWVISLRSGDVRCAIGGAENYDDRFDTVGESYMNLPEDYKDRWVHVTFIVDRENKQVGFAYDFDQIHWKALPDSLGAVEFDGYDLCIGADGMGQYSPDAAIDEFILIKSALTQTDVDGMKAYYTAEAGTAETAPQAPAETDPQAPAETDPQAPAETDPQAPAETEPQAPTTGEGGIALLAFAVAAAAGVALTLRRR